MFTEKVGLTNTKHLIGVIQEKSSVKISEEEVAEIVYKYLEYTKEIYQDNVLAGYVLVFNFMGVRSLHGYNFTEGYGVRAYRAAQKVVKDFDIKYITTTIDQLKTVRLARILGFKIERQTGKYICFERG